MPKINNIITLKLNLSKILDDHVYEGKKGRWLQAVLVRTPNSEWSDYMMVQDLGEDLRLSGRERPIIGNGIIRSAHEA